MSLPISAVTSFWLILGVILLLVEVSVIPGFGALFGGLGAFTVTVMVAFDIISEEDLFHQFITLLLASSIWLVVLWRPLINYLNSSAGNIKDISGSQAEVYSEELNTSKTGKIKWSGAIMNAKMAEGESRAEKDETVLIDKIEGNTAICKKSKEAA